MKLRKIIFWCHLTSGAIAAAVIFVMSFTGVILTFEPQIAAYAERHVRWVAPAGPDAKRLSVDAVVARVREANSDARPAIVTVQSDPAASVIVNLGREDSVFVNPYTGELLGTLSPAHKVMHAVVDWHRWLGMEDEGRATGRAITGACNLAFLGLALTGVYLWWPRSWAWRALKSSLLFNARLRGKARDWNWHNVIGFWSSAVLVILTLTGSVMSYPWANDLLYTLTGSEPPPRPQGTMAKRSRGPEQTARTAKAMASLDALVNRAQQQVPGWTAITMRFPPLPDAPITLSIQEPDAPHLFARSQLALDRFTGEIVKWEPYSSYSTGRKLRTWVRALHTGEAGGVIGQLIAGLASLGGCFLVWTGLAMAWRRFRSWRGEPKAVFASGQAKSATSTSLLVSRDIKGGKSSVEFEALREESYRGPDPLRSQTPTNGQATHGFEAVNPPTAEISLLILFGSVTGNAESVAWRAAEAARRTGFNVRVRDMAHCQASILARERFVLIVTSTFGNGQPPDNATAFWETVVRGNGMDLRGVRFSVLALGDSTFDHFCRCGRELDAALERLGATRLFPRVDCDIDFDGPANFWIEGVLATLQGREGLASVSR